jgi:signal peptide peptidase SppA
MKKNEELSQSCGTDGKKSCCIKNIINKFRSKEPRVAVLRLSGVIGEGGIRKRGGLTLEDLEEDIEKAFDVYNVKAVAVQVNSPGGSPVQSELIATRIRQLSEEKKVPVYTFVEEVGASGGYWLACAGEEIYAHGSSVVGSIGVIASMFGFVDAIKKLGVERRVYAQGENKSILDPFKEEKASDVAILKNMMADIHEEFKNMVRNRRAGKIRKEDENLLFSGEFWTGTRAKELGLIDDIGEMRSVMRKKFGDKVEFEKIMKPKGWLKRKLGFLGSEFADGLMGAVAEKAVWARFGL